jgi:hypothetical protein
MELLIGNSIQLDRDLIRGKSKVFQALSENLRFQGTLDRLQILEALGARLPLSQTRIGGNEHGIAGSRQGAEIRSEREGNDQGCHNQTSQCVRCHHGLPSISRTYQVA